MKDNAMSYEYLIRRAHQCSRFEVAGANADIFRKLQRAARTYIGEKEIIDTNGSRMFNTPEEEMLTEYMVNAGEVSAYIKTAIDLVQKKYKNELSDEQYDELNQVITLLSFPDMDNIDNAVERSEKVMYDIGLFPK